MQAGVGLRERKKQRTRQEIADVALRLFLERGFDAVTVVEIAAAAEVAEKTVYNYFPTKEDLVFRGLEEYEDRLLAAVRDRAPGLSIVSAFRDFVISSGGLLARDDASGQLRAVNAMISGSSRLQQREQQIFHGYTASLAAVIAAEVGSRRDDLLPWTVANALIGAHRGLIDYVRRQTAAGRSNATITRNVRTQAIAVCAALESGLGHYGTGER